MKPVTWAVAERVRVIKVVTCPLCGDTVFSRAARDVRSCSCSETEIWGGPHSQQNERAPPAAPDQPAVQP